MILRDFAGGASGHRAITSAQSRAHTGEKGARCRLGHRIAVSRSRWLAAAISVPLLVAIAVVSGTLGATDAGATGAVPTVSLRFVVSSNGNGGEVSFEEAVSGSLSVPTGWVSILIDGQVLGACADVALNGGQASCDVAASTLGRSTHRYVATYSGDATYQSGSSPSQPFSVVSVPVAVTAEGIPPGPPTAVVASAPAVLTTVDAESMTWAAPSSPGSSPITSYSVQATDVTTQASISIDGIAASATSMDFTGLTAGDLYTFTVTAWNVFGAGSPSSPSNAAEPVSAPRISVNFATSSTASGTAVAVIGIKGDLGSIVAAALGIGTIVVATYATNPIPQLSVPGTFYDVSTTGPSTFDSAVITFCGVPSGVTVAWWDPLAHTLVPASDQTAPSGPNACVDVTFTPTTVPNLSQLVGTVFVIASTAPTVVQPPHPVSGPVQKKKKKSTTSAPVLAGLLLAAANGDVASVGGARYFGSLLTEHVKATAIDGIARQPGGGGYWLTGSTGHIHPFGSARFWGYAPPSTGRYPATFVGIAPTPDGKGYWIVGNEGEIYAFGSAHFYGSLTYARHLPSAPIVGIGSSADGHGYLIVGANGAVYTFGDAGSYGSLVTRRIRPASPVVGIATVPRATGYLLVTARGVVYAFGSAHRFVPNGTRIAPSVVRVVAIAANDATGYWTVDSKGHIYAYGTAARYSVGSRRQFARPIVAAR